MKYMRNFKCINVVVAKRMAYLASKIARTAALIAKPSSPTETDSSINAVTKRYLIASSRRQTKNTFACCFSANINGKLIWPAITFANTTCLISRT